MIDNELDAFESALLMELRDEVSRRTPARPFRRTVLRVAAPIALAASVVVGVTVGPLGGAEPAAAFAVNRLDDGDLTVTVKDWSDPAALERELGRHGVVADVEHDADAVRPSDLDRGALAAQCSPADDVVVDHGEDGAVEFTLDAEAVDDADRMLQITAAGGGPADGWVAVSVTWREKGC